MGDGKEAKKVIFAKLTGESSKKTRQYQTGKQFAYFRREISSQ